jgi:putative oxidoreductase
MHILKTAGRICLAAIFVAGGAGAFRKPGGRVQKVQEAGLPQPEFGVRLNGATMVIAGIVLALGIAPKWAAGALLGSHVPTTLIGHPYWKEESVESRTAQRTQFLKNLGLIGGLLWVMAEEETERDATPSPTDTATDGTTVA